MTARRNRAISLKQAHRDQTISVLKAKELHFRPLTTAYIGNEGEMLEAVICDLKRDNKPFALVEMDGGIAVWRK